MKKMTLYFLAGCAVLLVGQSAQGAAAEAQAESAVPEMVALQPADLTWSDLGLVPGVQIAVLSGDPSQPGHYVLRLKFPPDTRMPAHWHPRVEYATILSGTLMLAMGEEEIAEDLQAYPAGSFLVAPPRMAHYGRSVDEVIFELSGPGPYEVVFVDPADDPRIVEASE